MSIANIERLQPAPRNVPLLLKLQLLFSGALSQFGWFFFGFGMIFVWVFVPNCDWRSLSYIGAHLVYEQGEVYNVERTNFSVGGGKGRSGHPVYANYYRFGLGGDDIYEGVSYSTTSLSPGTKVNIEHPQDNTGLSRIEGMGNAPLDLLPVFFIFIFPGIGLIFIIGNIKNGIKAIKLLKNGNPGYGKLESVNYANMRINDKNVYKFIFRYAGNNGISYKLKAATEQSEVLQDEELEQIMIDRDDPAQAILVDILPGGIEIDSAGNIKPSNFVHPFLVSFIPFLVIIGNCIWLYISLA